MELLYILRGLVLISCIVMSTQKPTEKPEKYGPDVGMDFMHGVLMHGDENTGDDHKNEDTYLRLQAQDEDKAKQLQEGVGPCKGGDCVHDLMHKEGEGVQHMEQKTSDVAADSKQEGPMDAMESLHGVLMHGDEEEGKDHKKDHDKMKAEDNQKHEESGPKDAMDELHGVLMHGDEEQGVDHAKEDQEKIDAENEKPRPESNVQDAHQFMHPEENTDNLHDDKPRMDVGPRGVPSVSDPHEAIHGDLDKKIQIGEANDEDKEDYENWRKGGKADDDANFLGFSFPFISDSIMDEIQLLKKKWLPKNWYTPEEGEETIEEAKEQEEDKINNEEGAMDILQDMAGVGDTGPTSEQNGHHHSAPYGEKSKPNHDES